MGVTTMLGGLERLLGLAPPPFERRRRTGRNSFGLSEVSMDRERVVGRMLVVVSLVGFVSAFSISSSSP